MSPYAWGKQYRSRGEQRLARALDEQLIEYQYEPRLVVYDPAARRDRWLRPDFYLPDHQAVIEYAGMLDRPAYRERHGRKAWLYHTNGIPLIEVLPEDLERRDWERSLLEQIAASSSHRQIRNDKSSQHHASTCDIPAYQSGLEKHAANSPAMSSARYDAAGMRGAYQSRQYTSHSLPGWWR